MNKYLGTQKTVARNSIDEILCEYTLHKFNFRTIKVFPCKMVKLELRLDFIFANSVFWVIIARTLKLELLN